MSKAQTIVEFFEFRPLLLAEKAELEAKLTEEEALAEALNLLEMFDAASCVTDNLRTLRDQLYLVETDLAVATVV